MLQLVSATRLSREHFMRQSLLGRSLPRLGDYEAVGLTLFAENRAPIGERYNEVIESAAHEDVLVFVHDDVYIEDWCLRDRLNDALAQFDVVGVAGNTRLAPDQEAWHLTPDSRLNRPETLRLDTPYLRGAVSHGDDPQQAALSVYGASPAQVAVLDGLLIATRAGTLKQSGVRFDPALGFHFYDLDFCRAATAAGLRLGTWPIALTHRSRGESVKSEAWAESLRVYAAKWRGAPAAIAQL